VQLSPTWHEGYHHLGLAFQEMGMMGYAEARARLAQGTNILEVSTRTMEVCRGLFKD